VEQLFAPTSTTKICVIEGADPTNMLISVLDLFDGYLEGGSFLTKEKIEALLTGDINSH
jgi:hypothetical protein